ncbi:ankyrin [Penaeus vannamei]|uniref:Ankyrin n=1 Tax=Penaeus vannamei TaxID=6689 RepID=A0A3R7PJQ0_PENVA|nr:ankyrin [Penaeus vannamei]
MKVDHPRRPWSAVRQGDAEAARKCLDSGADVAIKDESGDTPLHHVSMHGSLPMAKVLLDAGANPDAANDSLQTPLQYASESGKVKITKLLFESKGLTPFQTASTYKQRPKTRGREIVSLLATVANIPKSSATYEAF